jgi:tetratricopeptide (TPR) repeat protein
MLELNKRDYVGIYFDQVGAKALATGHIREALESDRALIAAHPTEAVHHVRLARALLEAGIGDEAHDEARKATVLDPKSANAFSTLGWTLQHNDLGERFGKGFDRAGAIAAYKQSIALDPEDNDPRFDLAILYEFDAHGIRYAADADLPAAIAVYRELVTRTEKTDPQSSQQYRENLLYALLYARQFAELDKMLATLPASSAHTSLAITSATAQHGPAAGIAAAAKGNVPATERNKDLRLAGNQLAGLRMYAEAAEILTAGMQGGDDAATVARQVELYRSLKTASLKPLPASDPKSPVQRVTIGMMDGSLTKEQAEAALSNEAYASPAGKQRDVTKTLSTIGFMRSVAAKTGFSEPVLLDLIAGNMTYTATGDDRTGYAIVVQSPGSGASRYFVVKEDGSYRIVADEHDNVQVGNAVLYALKHDNPAQAKALLDWKRDFTHKGATDDAFYGPLLPRFWTIGSSKPGADSPEAMQLAALALLAGSMDEKPYLPELVAARDKATGAAQTDLDLLLAVAGVGAEQPEIALPAAERLLAQEPDSLTALRLAGESFAFKHDPAGWQAMLAPRLAKKPTDHDLLAEQARAYAAAHDFVAAQATAKKVLDSGKAEAGDYNEYAWLGLFSGKLDEEVGKAAQQGSMMAKNSSFAELHTLACIYAAQGKTTEARQIVQEAMYAGSQAEPNSAVWYALGLIYEQYGAKAAALNAYKRVQAHELDDHTFVDATATYVLAQERISKLGS